MEVPSSRFSDSASIASQMSFLTASKSVESSHAKGIPANAKVPTPNPLKKRRGSFLDDFEPDLSEAESEEKACFFKEELKILRESLDNIF